MTKADTIFKENITKIMEEGVWSEQARPKYKDGTTANSKYITGSFAEYDLSKGEFPITTLRPIAIKSAIKEVLWIYQDQSNSLDVLEDKYNVHYWNDWEVEGVPANNGDKRSIGQRYGAVVKKHDIINRLLAQLEANQMMIAKHFGWKVGKFFYFINNLHIYDNQFEQAEELLKRQPSDCQPRLVLNVPDGTNFFDIKPEDFELVDYDPVKPQLKFDLAI